MPKPIMNTSKTYAMTNSALPELLAPAGDFECLQAAIRFGANAVYIGGTRFGMRSGAANFDAEQLAQAVQYAHKHGVKVYLTLNILPHNRHIKEMPEYIKTAVQAGIDAFILSDIGVLSMVKELAPETEMHVSTQAGIVNYASAREFYKMGAARVILARELSLEEIKEIRENTPSELEIEVFVHGAICMSYSGRCLLSHYMTGRDANLGECAQSCRWNYTLSEEKRPGEYHPVFEDESGTAILSAADLCMIEHLDKLRDAGVSSFKIEGRAKSMYYVSAITNAYVMAVKHLDEDGYKLPDWIRDEVYKVSHRGYNTGFFLDSDSESVDQALTGYVKSQYGVMAVVSGYDKGCITASQKGKFYRGDTLEVMSPGIEPFTVIAEDIYNERFEPIESTPHAEMKIYIKHGKLIPTGSILRKKH